MTTQKQKQKQKKDFLEEIREVINRHSAENDSNTPDYILANYMCQCLDAFTHATKLREKWYGRKIIPFQVTRIG